MNALQQNWFGTQRICLCGGRGSVGAGPPREETRGLAPGNYSRCVQRRGPHREPFPGAPAAPWWEGLAALGAHAGLLARAAPMDMAFAINLSPPLSPLKTGGREQTEFAALILSTHCSIFPQNQTLMR